MNANKVRELAQITLSGARPFPEIVGHLIGEGVEYYHVDYLARQFTFYGKTGNGIVVAPLTYEGLPQVAEHFNATGLRAAILDSQQYGQKYRDFCRRAMEAGVQSYFAFLRGQRVTYLGRQGDQHIEWFPGAKPTDA